MAREVIQNLLESFKVLPEDCTPQRWVAAAEFLAMTTYGDVYDGQRTRCDNRGDPYWVPRDWSCQLDQLKHFIETGERKHFRSVNLAVQGFMDRG